MTNIDDRTSLARAFAKALAADFAAHGPAAIAELRTTKVDAYLRLVAGVEPAAASDQPGVAASMSDEEVLAILADLDRWAKENPPAPEEECA